MPATLVYDESERDDSNADVVAQFELQADGARFRQRIVGCPLGLELTTQLRPDVAADAMLISGVAALERSFAEHGARELDVTPTTEAVLDAAGLKSCRYREVDAASMRCGAPHACSFEGGEVDEEICRSCDVPDARIACSYWNGSVVRLQVLPDGGLTRETLAINCALGQPGSECVPGGSPCWVRDLAERPTTSPSDPPTL